MTDSDVKVDQTVETANTIAMRGLMKELEENRYNAVARREILDKIDKLARYEAEAANPKSKGDKVVETAKQLGSSWFFWSGLAGAIAAVGRIVRKNDR